MANYVQVLFDHNQDRGDYECFTDRSESVTYRQLQQRVNSVASELTKIGIGPGDHVAVAMYDSISTVAIILATALVGAVPALANPRSVLKNLSFQITSVEPKLICIESALVDNCKDFYSGKVWTTEYIHQISQCVQPTVGACHRENNDPALMFYTSGTTGHSKIVVHGHKFPVLSNLMIRDPACNITSQDRVYVTGKLSFSYGFCFGLLQVMWAGAHGFLDSGLSSPLRVVANIKKFKPTFFFSVPAVYAYLVDVVDSAMSVKKCISAGDVLHETIISNWKKKTNNTIHNVFGASEIGVPCLINRSGDSLALGSVINEVNIKIVDEAGNNVPDGTPGMLMVQSPCSALGYLNDQEWTEKTFLQDNWFVTGDMVVKEAGIYYYMFRNRDTLKVNGMYVNFNKIENSIISYPGVKRAVVTSQVDQRGLAHIHAFIIPASEKQIIISNLKTWLRERHESWECPREFHFVSEIPLTDNGKVQKHLLKEKI